MTTDLLDSDIPTETYTVHDKAGFDALPFGTHLEDADGDRFEKVRGGYREYGDAEPWYTHLYLSTPAVVLNPEVLGTTSPLTVGDRATINDGADIGFQGLAVQVLKFGYDNTNAYVQPLSERPDGHGLTPFYWVAANLTAFTPEPLKVGDRVRRISDSHFIRSGAGHDYGDMECRKGEVGTVTRFSMVPGDGVSVSWDKGNTSVIAAAQLAPYVAPLPTFEPGQRVRVTEQYDGTGHAFPLGQIVEVVRMGGWDGDNPARVLASGTSITGRECEQTLKVTSVELAPEPKPVFENFDMTGAYVKGQEALDALPNMTIVDPLSSYLPMLKLRSGEWVSIGNVSKHGPTPSAGWVKDSVVEHGGVVVYASPEDD